MVPVGTVVGRVVAVWWPWDHATGVGRTNATASPGTPSQSTPSSSDTPARALRPGLEALP
jgi:hypothetical protein